MELERWLEEANIAIVRNGGELRTATWREVLVVGLAVLVGAVPVLARVDAGLQVATAAVQQTSVPLPNGDEMGDDGLLQTEGEFFWFWIIAILAGGATAVHDNWFDEDHGISKSDLWAIFGAAACFGGAAHFLSGRVQAIRAVVATTRHFLR